MSDLTALIERTARLTGPDREVDGLIFGWLHKTEPCGTFMCGFDEEKFQFRHPEDDPNGRYRAWYVRGADLPLFTVSLDAAVALAVKLLDNGSVDIEVAHRSVGGTVYGRAEICGPHTYGKATGKTPAIALVLATLRALQAQEDGR